MKIGIVCEGGGMRGVYTAGVLQAFLDETFKADLLIGVSAGASNGVSYISGQSGRGYRTNVDYAGDKRYASPQSFIKTGSFFGMDFIFGEIPEKLDPFDFKAFYSNPCDFYTGVTDVNTGLPHYFGKKEITPGLTVLRASCSIPIMSPIVHYKGGEYLDGGVSVPIPYKKAIDEGCDKLIVVLTRDRSYRKEPQKFKALYHAKYVNHPNLAAALDVRHRVYNHSLKQIARLEEDGKAIVIAPFAPLETDRFGKDKEALINCYNFGHADGLVALKSL